MFRFLACVWNSQDPAQTAAVRAITSRLHNSTTRWRTALDAEGLRVFCANERSRSASCQLIAGERGVVLGTLFHRSAERDSNGAPQRAVLDSRLSDRIVSTSGSELIDACWGSYVAIISNPSSRRTRILRSPAGSLPCLRCDFERVRIYFSLATDWTSLGLAPVSINWSYVARYLTKTTFSGETGLSGISEIQSGQGEEFGHESRIVCWDPLRIARREPIEDAARATTELRNTVRACVLAWASCHDNVLHLLSGGLDSSIVLACLRGSDRGPAVTCVTRHSPGPESDERDFARLAAEHAHCELIELARDPSYRFEDVMRARPAETPQNYMMLLSQARAHSQLARERNATAIFTGTFGDQVFFGPRAQLIVADYIHRHGIGPRLIDVALTAARLDACSIWNILRRSCLLGMLRVRWDPIADARHYSTLLNEEAVRSLQDGAGKETPWYRRDAYVPPGKQFHIFSLARPEEYYSPYEASNEPELVSPLMSQPLVELCLRIPTYVLTSNGWDREIARTAFAGEVPAQIVRRRSKGGQEEHTAEVYRRNLGFIRELLLDGDLVKHGLLNRAKLSDALSGRPSGVLKGMAKLTRYITVEIWLRLWADCQEKASPVTSRTSTCQNTAAPQTALST